jgi:hypothetical protein
MASSGIASSSGSIAGDASSTRELASSLRVDELGAEGLRAAHRYEDEPFKARWECLHAAEDCTAIAFDLRGVMLAVATRDGVVRGTQAICMARQVP